MPPIQESGEFDAFDSAGDAKAEKQAVEVRFHRAQGDVELLSDFFVAATLQQQFSDLSFARRQPD